MTFVLMTFKYIEGYSAGQVSDWRYAWSEDLLESSWRKAKLLLEPSSGDICLCPAVGTFAVDSGGVQGQRERRWAWAPSAALFSCYLHPTFPLQSLGLIFYPFLFSLPLGEEQ